MRETRPSIGRIRFMGMDILILRLGPSTIHIYGGTMLVAVLLERQYMMISYGTGAERQVMGKLQVHRVIWL